MAYLEMDRFGVSSKKQVFSLDAASTLAFNVKRPGKKGFFLKYFEKGVILCFGLMSPSQEILRRTYSGRQVAIWQTMPMLTCKL